jgi:flagellar biosynthesis component FlhA
MVVIVIGGMGLIPFLAIGGYFIVSSLTNFSKAKKELNQVKTSDFWKGVFKYLLGISLFTVPALIVLALLAGPLMAFAAFVIFGPFVFSIAMLWEGTDWKNKLDKAKGNSTKKASKSKTKSSIKKDTVIAASIIEAKKCQSNSPPPSCS